MMQEDKTVGSLMTSLITAFLGGTAIACSAAPPSTSTAPEVTIPERVPSPEPVEPVVGKVPDDLVQKMRAHLARKIGAAANSAAIVRAEALTWPDGSLGCRLPGEIHTQQLVPGYRVEFQAGEATYAYHAAAKTGFFKLCLRNPRSISREQPIS
ncbi:MAG: hypothetical protein ACRETT_11830 [Steroidobacteraceae bacterium]